MASEKHSGYALTRRIFDFATTEKECTYVHIGLFLWCVEKSNRLGWRDEFQLASDETMEVLSFGNKRTFLAALDKLVEWGFIEITQESTNQYHARYIRICRSKKAPAKDTAEQQHSHSKGTGRGTSGAPNIKPIKPIKPEKQTPPLFEIEMVILYLNKKANKNFRASSKETQKLIQARLNEGFTPENFSTVIDNRVSVWGGDVKMKEFLRPETLFGSKFESYLNAATTSDRPTAPVSQEQSERDYNMLIHGNEGGLSQ